MTDDLTAILRASVVRARAAQEAWRESILRQDDDLAHDDESDRAGYDANSFEFVDLHGFHESDRI